MNLAELFTSKFLFQINRIQIQSSDKFFLLLAIAALAIAALFKLSAKFAPGPVDAKYRNKLFNIFLFLFLAELIWYGARIQLVRFFGTHFAALLIIAISIVWLMIVLWKIFRHYSEEKKTWEKEQVRLKYLPK